MPVFNWTESYKVGVSEFDDQHKRWFKLLNELQEAMSQGKGKQVVGKTLQEVLAYTQTHFSAEEKQLQATGYPDYEEHKALHDAYVMQIQQMQKSFFAGSSAVSIEMLNSMHDWLVKHIQGHDKQYGAHLNAKGVR